MHYKKAGAPIRPLKIVHVITGLGAGGAENMLYKLIIGMDKSIFENFVIKLGPADEIQNRFESAGITVFSCGIQPSLLGLIGIFKLCKYIRIIRPNLIQTWMHHSDLIGSIAARLVGFKMIVWNVRQSNLEFRRNKVHLLLAVWINAVLSYFIPTRIVANSNRAIREHIASGYKSDLFNLIPNGFDVSTYYPDKRARALLIDELNLPTDAVMIGMVARFDSQKDHHNFIIAAKILIQRIPNVYFVMVGAGVSFDNKSLRDLIGYDATSSRFRLLGFRTDIPRLNAALDLAVCSSWGESFPNTVGEAMSCGVPCVVTDVGDCPEVVADTGWVVPPGDFDALADKIHQALMLSSDELRSIGRQARLRIVENYSIERVINDYQDLYLDLLQVRF